MVSMAYWCLMIQQPINVLYQLQLTKKVPDSFSGSSSPNPTKKVSFAKKLKSQNNVNTIKLIYRIVRKILSFVQPFFCVGNCPTHWSNKKNKKFYSFLTLLPQHTNKNIPAMSKCCILHCMPRWLHAYRNHRLSTSIA